MKLALPHSILTQEEIKALRPRDRESYIESVILEVLALNPRGITVSQTSKATGFSRDTVSKHLERLLAIREAYKVDRGVAVFYKNGKVADEHDLKLVTSDDKTYTFYRLVNEDGEFIYIQEREIDEFRAVKVKGGIMISSKDFKPFMSALQNFGIGAGNQ
jgi:DNA-binding transcriptional ArsR family regulator